MSLLKRTRHSLGFTLIELMVVVAIIGILMAAGIVAFGGAQRNTRDAKRRADVDAIAKAAELYYQNTFSYASAVMSAGSQSVSWTDVNMNGVIGNKFSAGTAPVDPLNTGVYQYVYIGLLPNYGPAANQQTRFCASARLETANGNCTGNTGGSLSNPSSYQCVYVTPGTGTHYCASNRQ